MAVETFYRGVAFIKDFVERYLNAVFMAGAKGSILLTNGYKKITFSKTPLVIKRSSWDYRQLPSVLIGQARGNYEYKSIEKDHLYTPLATETGADADIMVYGGDIKLTLDLDIRATSIEERDNIVDIVCLYLAHPDAKDYFLKQQIVIPAPPTISGERDIFEPAIDHPIYGSTVSIPLISIWRVTSDIEYRLEEIFLEVDLEGSTISDGGEMHWSDPIDSTLTPLTDCTYDLGTSAFRFRNAYLCGKLTVGGGIDPTYLQLTEVNPGAITVPNNSFYVYSVDHRIKFKNASGVIVDITAAAGMDWSLPVDSNIVPDANNTRDLGTTTKRLKDAYFVGDVAIGGSLSAPEYFQLAEISTLLITVPNDSFYVDAADNKLKYKDSTGTIHSLTDANMSWSTPVDSTILPDGGSYGLGDATHKFHDLYLGGDIHVDGYIAAPTYLNFTEINTGVVSVPNDSFFVNVADDKIYYKDHAGASHDILAGGSGITWSTPVNAIITPDGNGTRDLALTGTRFKDAYFSGEVAAGNTSVNFSEMAPVTPASVSNYSVFLDSTNSNALSYKNGAGVVTTILGGTTSGLWSIYSVTDTVLSGATENETIITTSSGDLVKQGIIIKVQLTDETAPPLGSGEVTVRIFNDNSRADMIFEHIFDLAGELTDYLPCGFISDNNISNGRMYVDIENGTGSDGDFTVEVTVATVVPATVAPVGTGTGVDASVVGDGLTFDGNRINVNLETSAPGLDYTGVYPNKKLRVDSTVLRTTNATVLRTTGDQETVDCVKRFPSMPSVPSTVASGFGIAPNTDVTGPPTYGVWETGDVFCDKNLNLWRCTLGGTPGSWSLGGPRITHGIDTTSVLTSFTYTAEVAAGSSADVEVDTTHEYGMIVKLNIWGVDTAYGVSNIDQPFRVACYPNDSYYGRDQLWSLSGQMRKTNVAVLAAAGASTIRVNTVDQGAPGDLVKLHRNVATIGEEYNRISVRTTAPVQYETTNGIQQQLEVNDSMMFVTEYVFLPYWSNDATKTTTIFLRFYNDGATAVKYGYELDLINMDYGMGL
jgi:hypothetical protein